MKTCLDGYAQYNPKSAPRTKHDNAHTKWTRNTQTTGQTKWICTLVFFFCNVCRVGDSQTALSSEHNTTAAARHSQSTVRDMDCIVFFSFRRVVSADGIGRGAGTGGILQGFFFLFWLFALLVEWEDGQRGAEAAGLAVEVYFEEWRSTHSRTQKKREGKKHATHTHTNTQKRVRPESG